MVRRSVANNLDDLGKAHPELLARTCAAWLKGAGEERRWSPRRSVRLLSYGAASAWRRRPRARATLRTVAKLGLPSSLSAL